MSSSGKIFMLDDDKLFLDLYQHFLEANGYDVFTTDNAYKFLMYGREIKPDVMFLDINMPQLNGWEVLSQINNDTVLQNIPVVMLSVNQDEDLAAIKGVAHFLFKPPAFELLADIVESYGRGGQTHDLLLLEDYEPMFQDQQPEAGKLFITHSPNAAKKYLEKNQPKKIAIKYNPEKFEDIRKQLGREDAIRIDDLHDLD